jgi:hypothetical protein
LLSERSRSPGKSPNLGIFRVFTDQKLAMVRFALQATLRCDTPAAVRRFSVGFCA